MHRAVTHFVPGVVAVVAVVVVVDDTWQVLEERAVMGEIFFLSPEIRHLVEIAVYSLAKQFV